MKKFGTLVFFSIMVFILLAGCGSNATTGSEKKKEASKTEASSEIQKIKDRGKLIVGVKTDFPPFGSVNEKGETVGFEIELAKRFAKDLLGDESKIELVPVTGPNRVPYLQSNKVDIILATMSVTKEREEVVDFTNPHFQTAAQVLTKKDSGIKSVKDLAGKRVVVVKGSLGDLYLTKNIPSAQLTKFEMNTEALQALKDGRADAYLQDNVVLYYWARQNPDFHVLAEQIEPTPWAPAVKEGNKELKDWVNSELSKLGKEQFLHKLYEEHLRNELGPELDPDDFLIESK